MKRNNPYSAIDQAIDLLEKEGTDLSNLFKKGGVLKQLTKRLVEKAVEAEMQEHLGYEKYARNEQDNSRNGSNTKKIISDEDLLEL